MKRFSKLCLLFLLLNVYPTKAQKKIEIPKIYTNLFFDEAKNAFYVKAKTGKKIYQTEVPSKYNLKQAMGSPKGSSNGLDFDFGKEFNGTLYYGFIPYKNAKYPQPVYFKKTAKIIDGKASVNIAKMRGKYDMIGWEQSGRGVLGYRLQDSNGQLVYDGVIGFKGTGPFQVDVTIYEGPFVNILKEDGCTISFDTNLDTYAYVEINGKIFKGKKGTHHEIKVTGLDAGKSYDYTIKYGDNYVLSKRFSFKTALKKGSKEKFSFAYCSDSRSGKGGGERNLKGANYYIVKKIMALCNYKNAAFCQFSGDLINGYLTNKGELSLQYANWKRAIEPFSHYVPVYVTMGNHEAYGYNFSRYGKSDHHAINGFPFTNNSSESVFADNFVSPQNGPDSEDGTYYDPDKSKQSFPSYKENVFYYTYGNIAVIVLNTNYCYTSSSSKIPHIGGNLHAYIMDKQLQWFKQIVNMFEKDNDIDHIFVTQHTPFFPNGGHVHDDMWYNGDNSKRPYIAGKPLNKGIIERRDDLLDIVVNKSKKVRAVLTGDEHNYAKTKITPEMERYPKNYKGRKIKLKRSIYQINNGAAGAPYYAQEKTPWTPFVSGFSTQNALVFFEVEGSKITMKVINPDTLEEVDNLKLSE